MGRIRSATWALAVALSTGGCIRGAAVVAKPTAIELQLLGAYDELDKDLVHAGSVRARGPGEASSFEALEGQAIEARSVQRYNEDDLVELKAEGCIAEGLGAKVVARPCASTETDAAVGRRRERVVLEENRSRSAILTWAAYVLARNEGRPEPKAEELLAMKQAYERLLRETAKKGQLIETAPGRFEPVAR